MTNQQIVLQSLALAVAEPDFRAEPAKAFDWLTLVTLDPFVNESRAVFLERLTDGQDNPNPEFKAESLVAQIEAVAELGVWGVVNAGTFTIEQLFAISRSPRALRKLHKRIKDGDTPSPEA